MLYGLGTENQNMPGFVVVSPPAGRNVNCGTDFLPGIYQSTKRPPFWVEHKLPDWAWGVFVGTKGIPNALDAEKYLQREYRKGWKL